MFSATLGENVDSLIRLSLKNPVRVFVDNHEAIVGSLHQEFVRIREKESDRLPIILSLCKRVFKERCIIFFPSKVLCHRSLVLFGLSGLKAVELHGNLNQLERSEALEKFRQGDVDYLLATDVAARGLDIQGIQTVINHSMPMDYKQYQHRVGRTARALQSGKSVSLIGEQDRKVLKQVLKNSEIKVKHRQIPQQVLQKYRSKVNELDQKIEIILQQEKTEKLISVAEREAKKAENLISCEQEIKSRPKKTWFQSQKDKEKLKRKAKKAKE